MKNDFDSSWFDLNNYDAAKSFDGYEWFKQLLKRRFIKDWINDYPHYAEKQIPIIKESPLSDYEIKDFNNPPVMDATYDDFLLAEKKPTYKNASNIFDIHIVDDELNENGLHELAWTDLVEIEKHTPIIKQITSRVRPVLSVDLTVSDEELIIDFKRWLQEKRENIKNNPRKKMFTPNHFDRWKSLRILPYLDLTLISGFDGKDLPYYSIGDLLFPDDIDVDTTERVRKVVKPLADSLLVSESLSVLRAQNSNY